MAFHITRESSWTNNKHENVYFADRPRHKARFTSTRKTRNECCKSPRAKGMRQSRDWVLQETNMATDY